MPQKKKKRIKRRKTCPYTFKDPCQKLVSGPQSNHLGAGFACAVAWFAWMIIHPELQAEIANVKVKLHHEVTPNIMEGSVTAKYPHDAGAFTQGLFVHQGTVIESTGLYGHSNIRQVDLKTGQVIQQVDLPQHHFGEGITLAPDGKSIVQLTWKARTGYVYDSKTLRLSRSFQFTTTAPQHQGWGITSNASHIFVSDGTAHIYVWEWPSLKEVQRLTIVDHRGDAPRIISRLNELEWLSRQGRAELLANIWYEERIVRIDPSTGRVLGEYDCAELMPGEDGHNGESVLNGIAYDQERDVLLLTGKWWSRMYEISLG